MNDRNSNNASSEFIDDISNKKSKLVIKEMNCLTDFIREKAQTVKIYSKALQEIKGLNAHTLNASNEYYTVEESGQANEFVTLLKNGAVNVGGVKEECWKDRDDVNRFYHSALFHFICIYLDCGKDTLAQIQELKNNIKNGKISEVVQLLKSRRRVFLEKLKEIALNQQTQPANLVLTNPANPTNLGGAVTYKQGTVEEALCKRGEYLFYLLLYRAYGGDYQTNILLGLLDEFETMLEKNRLPIVNQADSNRIAQKWVSLIYKVSRKGYYIAPDEVHVNKDILFFTKDKLPDLVELNNLGYAQATYFINQMQIASVVDVACTDNRLETNALKVFGIKANEKKISLSQNVENIFSQIQKEFDKQPCILACVPLGCGAFGNKIEDFADALKEQFQDKNKLIEKILITRSDNWFQLVDSFSDCPDVNFSLRKETACKLWNTLFASNSKMSNFSIRHAELLLRYFASHLNEFDMKTKNNILQMQFTLALYHKTPDPLAYQMIMKFCYLLLGKQFSLLHQAVEKAIRYYDKHTGIKGTISKNVADKENPCLKELKVFHTLLFTKFDLEKQDSFVSALKAIQLLIENKNKNFPNLNPVSLLDRSFNLLRSELSKLPYFKVQTAISFFASSSNGSQLPIDFSSGCAEYLSEQDTEKMSQTCKAVNAAFRFNS